MNPQTKKKLIGAIVAAALAIAVYYGLIDQKQADNIRTQADQTLGTGPAGQQQTPAQQQTATPGPAPAPRQPAPAPAPTETQPATPPAPASTETQPAAPPAASPAPAQPQH